ncbi:PqqD family protein [Cohnella panacarvi]|uniref:PqqD family protein n=1 Tax=Cohnella panacarvi TaxID=400776 RepID=UPI00047E595C|nr:PqqD family protein [Cohnella panacarvi]
MDNDRILVLHPLTFLEEDEGVSIGRYGTDTFAVFPEEGAEIVRRLQEGKTVSEVCEWYERTYNDQLDIEDFIDTLRELSFIKEQTQEADAEVPPFIKGQTWGRRLFMPQAYAVYLLILAGAAWMMISEPSLQPAREQLYFSSYSTVVMIGLFVGQLPSVLIHEGMHLAAGRRLGLPSKLSVGRRMYFIVFESSMPGIWGVPKNRRYLPFLSGMLGDALFYSFCILIAGWLLRSEGSAIWASFFTALAYSTILQFAWQFYFYLQTDIYFVIVNYLGCKNLQKTSRAWLRNIWLTIIRAGDKKIDMSEFTDRDRQVAKWYAFIYAGGWIFMVFMLFLIFPVLQDLMSNVFRQLFYGTGERFWDSIVFLSLTLIQFGIAAYIYGQEIRRRRASKRAANV